MKSLSIKFTAFIFLLLLGSSCTEEQIKPKDSGDTVPTIPMHDPCAFGGPNCKKG